MTVPPFTPTWLDPAHVVEWLRLNSSASTDSRELDQVCADAERRAERSRPEWWVPADPDIPDVLAYEPDAETYQGAVMYAARTIRRRNSPSGVETALDGNPVFVSRYDADIAAKLKLDVHIRPGVG